MQGTTQPLVYNDATFFLSNIIELSSLDLYVGQC